MLISLTQLKFVLVALKVLSVSKKKTEKSKLNHNCGLKVLDRFFLHLILENGKPIYKGKDSCNADSGGPMVIREFSGDPWYQTGIVSFGPTPCGKLGSPGVYTKVSAFLPWIKNKLDD